MNDDRIHKTLELFPNNYEQFNYAIANAAAGDTEESWGILQFLRGSKLAYGIKWHWQSL